MLLSVNAQGNLMLVQPNKILRPHKFGIAYQTLQVLESSFVRNIKAVGTPRLPLG